MKHRVVYINGRFIPESTACLSLYDSALATGEVVIEVTRTFNHRPFQLREHLRRLFLGLKEMRLDIGINLTRLAELTQTTLNRNLPTDKKEVDWQIIHYISRGPAALFEMFPSHALKPTLIIQCIPLKNRLGKMAHKYRDGVDLVVTPQRVIPPQILSPQIKSRGRLDYILARIQAKTIKPGSTGVLLDEQGYVTEGTGTSLFVVKNGKIKTAPAKKVLNGTTRELIFRLSRNLNIPIQETDYTVTEAATADEIFITSTVICLVHARSFNDKIIGNAVCGPVTQRIKSAYIRHVGLDFAAQAQYYSRKVQQTR